VGAARRPAAALAALVLVTTVASLVAACSSNGAAKASPSTAAATLASIYRLSPGEQQCLRGQFAAHPAAAAPLARNRPVADAELAALDDVTGRCIGAAVLARTVLAGATGPTNGGQALSATQQTCVRSRIAQLPTAERGKLLAGLALSTVLSDIQTAELGQLTEGILTACAIAVPGAGTGTSITAPTA
jgi:hypothetical protein